MVNSSKEEIFREITEKLSSTTKISLGVLTPVEIAALKEYQGGLYNSQIGGFSSIQNFLRTGKTKNLGVEFSEKEVNLIIKNLDSAIEKAALAENTLLFRGIRDARTIFGNNLQNLKPGFVFEESGYTSTSSKRSIAASKFSNALNRGDKPLVFEIEAKSGSNAFAIDKIEAIGESEVVLPRNSKFEVVSVKGNKVRLRLKQKVDLTSTQKLPLAPLTANEALFDAMVRHQIYTLRLSSEVRNKIEKLLNQTEADIAEKIRDRLRNSKGLSSSMEVRRMETLIRVIRNIRTKAWSQITETWVEELKEIAKAEPELLQSFITTTNPVVVDTVLPQARLLSTIVTARPFEGRTLHSWAKTIAADDIRRIESAVRIGMVAGEPSDVIARRVVGTARLKGADGVTEITRTQAAGITRTAVNFVANEARAEFLMANSDLFQEEQYVATLDSRTTPVCRANDGELFKVGKGPRPPLHWNCRSIRVPVLYGEALGNRPAKPSTQRMLLREFAALEGIKATSRDALPRGMKSAFDKFERRRVRELTGQVPGSTSYQQWLKRQSKEFQDDVLGKTRAKLFRDGGLQLDKFVNRAGDQLNLKELAKKHAAAFKAAGLDPSAFN